MTVNPTEFSEYPMVLMELLTTLVLAAHLLAMNLASAGPLLCVWLRWRAVNKQFSDTGRHLAWWSIRALIIGMLMGGLIFLTVPSAGLTLALQRFPTSAYWYAGFELLFSLACIMAMAVGWTVLNRWWLALLAVVSASNLLYHFPPMMAVIGHLATNSRWTNEAVIDRPILLKLMTDGEVLALSFHFGLSSLAVSAIVLLQLLVKSRSIESIETELQSTLRRTATIALGATVLQVPVGIWLTFSLSIPARSALMGGRSSAALAFLAAIAVAIVLIQRLLAIALGETDRGSLRYAVTLVCVVVLLMTMSLRYSRPVIPITHKATKTASCQMARGYWNF